MLHLQNFLDFSFVIMEDKIFLDNDFPVNLTKYLNNWTGLTSLTLDICNKFFDVHDLLVVLPSLVGRLHHIGLIEGFEEVPFAIIQKFLACSTLESAEFRNFTVTADLSSNLQNESINETSLDNLLSLVAVIKFETNRCLKDFFGVLSKHINLNMLTTNLTMLNFNSFILPQSKNLQSYNVTAYKGEEVQCDVEVALQNYLNLRDFTYSEKDIKIDCTALAWNLAQHANLDSCSVFLRDDKVIEFFQIYCQSRPIGYKQIHLTVYSEYLTCRQAAKKLNDISNENSCTYFSYLEFICQSIDNERNISNLIKSVSVMCSNIAVLIASGSYEL